MKRFYSDSSECRAQPRRERMGLSVTKPGPVGHIKVESLTRVAFRR